MTATNNFETSHDGANGWAGSYEGVVSYRFWTVDQFDFARVELRRHPECGGGLIHVLFEGMLDGARLDRTQMELAGVLS